MRTICKLIFWMPVLVLFYVYQVSDRLLQTGEQIAYSADIGAAHDAAVDSVTGTQDGLLVFDPTIGTSVFKSSLANSLGLSASDLSPLPGTLFADPVQIIGLYFLGDDKAPKNAQGHPSYPYTFTATALYRGSPIQVKETIYGPSVVGIIQYTHDVISPLGTKPTSYKKTTYRYYPRTTGA